MITEKYKKMVSIVHRSDTIIGHGAFSIVYKAKLVEVWKIKMTPFIRTTRKKCGHANLSFLVSTRSWCTRSIECYSYVQSASISEQPGKHLYLFLNQYTYQETIALNNRFMNMVHTCPWGRGRRGYLDPLIITISMPFTWWFFKIFNYNHETW